MNPEGGPPPYIDVLFFSENVGDDSIQNSFQLFQFGLDGEPKWSLLNIKGFHNCWPDRGHIEYSAEPCL